MCPPHAEEQTGTAAYRGSLVTKAVTCWLLSSKDETKSECCFLPHSGHIPTSGQITTQTSASRQHRYLPMFSSKAHCTRLRAVPLAMRSCGRQEGLGQTAVIRDGGNASKWRRHGFINTQFLESCSGSLSMTDSRCCFFLL